MEISSGNVHLLQKYTTQLSPKEHLKFGPGDVIPYTPAEHAWILLLHELLESQSIKIDGNIDL